MFTARAVLAGCLFAALIALPASAASSDCSTMKIPETPVKGTVGEQPFVPNEVTIHATPKGMVINQNSFDRYELSIQTDGIFNAATVSFLVRTGTHPDGRIFRALPTDSISAQPAAAPGTPEIQGWDLQLEAANVDTSFTQAVASIRLEIGKQVGDALPGRIYFCVPDVNATIRGTFSAKVIR